MKNVNLKILLSILIIISLIPTTISFGSILVWDENSESDLGGYKIHFGFSPNEFQFIIDVGNVTEYNLKDCNLKESETYFFALTSYDTSNNESSLSEEVDYFADDEIPENEDNCPFIYNPGQEDSYPPEGNSIGDACDCEGDFDCDGDVDAIDYMKFKEDCFDISLDNYSLRNGDLDCDGDVDGTDSAIFKLDFGRNKFANSCPPCEIGSWCER